MFRRWFHRGAFQKSHSRRGSFVPRCEVLEDRRLLSSFMTLLDQDQDVYTVKLTGPGTATVTLNDPENDGRGPIERIALADTNPRISRLTVSVTEATGDGAVDVGAIEGAGLKGIDARSSDLVGAGIDLDGSLGMLAIRDLLLFSEVRAGGTASQRTSVTARTIAGGNVIDLGSGLGTFRATAVRSALIKVAGSVNSFQVGAFISSELFVGFVPGEVSSPLQGGTFTPGLRLNRFKAGSFENSDVAAASVGPVTLTAVATMNNGNLFGILAGRTLTSVVAQTPQFRYVRTRPTPQGIEDFQVRLGALPSVAFVTAVSSGVEGTSPANLTVTLSRAAGVPVTVDYGVTGGTATAGGVDYTLASGTLTFAPGQRSQTIPLAIVNDADTEPDETIQVALSNPKNARLGTTGGHTFAILDDDQSGRHIVYKVPNPPDGTGHIYRLEARAGATPEDLSAALDLLSAGQDDNANLSPDGQWLALTTTRFDAEASGYAALAVVSSDLSSREMVRANGQLVHPEGPSAVASGGNLVVFVGGDGAHTRDLWVVRRSGQSWSAPVALTGASTFAYNAQPAISNDGTKVLFDCGNQPYAATGTNICEVGTDGTGYRVVVRPSDSPAGLTDTAALHHADYAPDGSIVFEADWTAEQIWRLPVGANVPVRVSEQFSNDNSPCVLPNGSIVSLWLDRAGNAQGRHEIKVMAADGTSFEMLLTGGGCE